MSLSTEGIDSPSYMVVRIVCMPITSYISLIVRVPTPTKTD